MTLPQQTPSRAGGLPWIHRRPHLHRNLNRAVVITLVLFALGQVFLRTTDILPMGRSLTAFVTYGMVGFVTIMGLLWLVFCSRFNRRIVWVTTALVLVSIGGTVASIRRIHFSGDSLGSIEWKWQKTADQRLEEYQASLGKQEPASAVPAEFAIGPDDMASYRGPARDGVVSGPPLCQDWQASPPKVEWKHQVGGGYAQPVVVGNSLVTIEQRRDSEVVVAYDATTGRELWTYSSPGKFDETLGGPGPRSTPSIHEGRIYSLGALGHLACLDLATGTKIWSRELLQELNVSNQEWGITSSPLVDGDRLIVNVGGYYGGGLIAVKLSDGTDLWQSEGITAVKDHPPKIAAVELEKSGDVVPADSDHAPPANPGGGRNRAGYCSPVIVTLAGVKQILNFDGLGLWGHDSADGHILWFHHFENGPGVNAAQPILLPEDRVLISASYGFGSRLLKITQDNGKWSIEPLWKDAKSLESKMSSPVLVEGYVYGLDEGFLTCIDPATGKQTWKKSRDARYGHGQLLVNNGLILVLSEYGDVVLIKPQPDKLVQLGKLHVLDGEKTWNPPALARGKLYVRNHYEMARVDLLGRAPEQTAEAPR
jgi:outer membrane protein assembly factor BamB